MLPRMKKFKKILLEQLKSTTCHGVPNILRNDLIVLKLMWLVVTSCGLACLCFFTFIGVRDYFKYEVNTKTRYIYEPIRTLPKVTICNQNQFITNFSIDYLAQLIKADSAYKYLNNLESNY